MRLSAEWTNSGCLLARNQCSFKKLIWVLSCIQNIQFLLMENSTQAITFKIERRNFSWFCSAIYASPNPAARKLLWNQLRDISHLCTGPWLMLGAFNEILGPQEVSGGTFSMSRALTFANMIDKCNMLEIEMKGGRFTWRKNIQNGIHVRKKLDRCLSNPDWRINFFSSCISRYSTNP